MSAWSANMHVEWKSSKKNDFCNLGGIFYMRNITLFWLPSCFTQALNLFCIQKRGKNSMCVNLCFCIRPAWLTHVCLSVWAGTQSLQSWDVWTCARALPHGSANFLLWCCACTSVDKPATTSNSFSSFKPWEQAVFILSRNRVSGTLNVLWWFCCF